MLGNFLTGCRDCFQRYRLSDFVLHNCFGFGFEAFPTIRTPDWLSFGGCLTVVKTKMSQLVSNPTWKRRTHSEASILCASTIAIFACPLMPLRLKASSMASAVQLANSVAEQRAVFMKLSGISSSGNIA